MVYHCLWTLDVHCRESPSAAAAAAAAAADDDNDDDDYDGCDGDHGWLLVCISGKVYHKIINEITKKITFELTVLNLGITVIDSVSRLTVLRNVYSMTQDWSDVAKR